jgi:hypothetical protein
LTNFKIFLFSRDPGGANTIIPLVAPLKSKGYKLYIYGKDFSLLRYSKFGLNGKDIKVEIANINVNSVELFLRKIRPDIIITGTSANDFTEKYIWQAAKNLGIYSIAILDHWINYGVRFSKYAVSDLDKYIKNKRHVYLPSKIAVMDEYAKLEMIKEGINKSLIFVSGQPFFEFLNIQQKEYLESKDNLVVAKDKDDFVISYISEAISQTYPNNYWGYTEKTIFDEFLYALDRVISNFDKKITLIIKIHPREIEAFYLKKINSYRGKGINFIIDKQLNSWELICKTDIVCGMISMFLIEASILKKPVISMQIGLKRKNNFVLDRMGIVDTILDRESLLTKLNDVIINKKFPQSYFSVISNPIEKIINHIEDVL